MKKTFSRRDDVRPLSLELFDIKPVMLGGDSNDPKNKVWLTRQQHIEAVRYWNRVIRELRAGQSV